MPPIHPASAHGGQLSPGQRSAGAAQLQDRPGHQGAPAGDPHPGAPMLWILDDDERLCALLDERLAALGWDLACFVEARAFEEALQISQPDLLVLDEMLPGRSGADVLAGLRLRGCSFPVLMLSALRSAQDRIAGLEAGADDYLGKPFELRELQLRIQRLLDQQSRMRAVLPPPAGSFRLASLLFDVDGAELRCDSGALSRLSRGDAALLLALCRRPGAVVGRQLLARTSGSLVDPSQSRSIDVRMGRLRRLLQSLLPAQGEVIESCRGAGYRLLVAVTTLPGP
ncbi:MAG: response regulator transcription factor [Cyanobium sp.]